VSSYVEFKAVKPRRSRKWRAELAGGDVGFEELLGRLAALP
jgi:hypothetical protein